MTLGREERRLPPLSDANAVVAFASECLDRLDEAAGLSAIDAALAFNSADARFFQLKGLLWRSCDELSQACEAFDKAFVIAPRDARIAHGRARCYLEAGRNSADLFAYAHSLAPHEGGLAMGWAAAEVAEGRIEAAIKLIDRRLAASPIWAEGHAYLAQLRWMAGDRTTYSASFAAALRSAPACLDLWRHYLAVLLQGRQFEKIFEITKEGPFSLQALFQSYQAVAFDETGDSQRAATLFDKIDVSSDAGNAIYKIRNFLRRGMASEAAALAEKWIANPAADSFKPYLHTAWRLLEDQRWESLGNAETDVGVYDISDRLDVEGAASALEQLHVFSNHPIDQSVRTGSQTDGNLFAREAPAFRTLRAACADIVASHACKLANSGNPAAAAVPLDAARVRFSGAWSVKLSGGGHHTNHVHPGGALSSALYFKLPETGAQTSPMAGWLGLGEPPSELGLGLAPLRHIEPKPGRLVLFPSTMWHGTVPFETGERLTVAFDVAGRPR